MGGEDVQKKQSRGRVNLNKKSTKNSELDEGFDLSPAGVFQPGRLGGQMPLYFGGAARDLMPCEEWLPLGVCLVHGGDFVGW